VLQVVPASIRLPAESAVCAGRAGLAACFAAVPNAQLVALNDIYVSTNGAGWINNDGWSTGGDPCWYWFGVGCSTINGQTYIVYVRVMPLAVLLQSLCPLPSARCQCAMPSAQCAMPGPLRYALCDMSESSALSPEPSAFSVSTVSESVTARAT
jgi:hypothetical protein